MSIMKHYDDVGVIDISPINPYYGLFVSSNDGKTTTLWAQMSST